MDNQQISQFDQASALLADGLPPLWRRMYERMLEVGFDEVQAIRLLQTYIFAAMGGRMER